MAAYFFAFLFSLCMALYLTPFVRAAALKYDIVDKPDGKLKFHKKPVAYLGGLSVYVAFLFTVALYLDFQKDVLGMLLAGTIIIMIGIIDDLKTIDPKLKLIGQAIAVFVLIRSGIYIQLFFLPYWACIILTFFWLIGTTNAFNIIDVMDGLSTGIGIICCLTLFVISLLNGRPMIAVLSISLAGALIGFLRFNFNPATIYLGDSGSMFLGLIIGSLAMTGSYTENNLLACLAPVVILGVPIFDTLFVMYIRRKNGIPVMYGSTDHYALRLRKWKLTTKQTVVVSYVIGTVLGLSGIGMMLSPTNGVCLSILFILIGIALVIGFLLSKVDMTR
jgi:UDP-GlcNAc:undecaprenyl-phosphate GlcNAc-1-phosphate transferase